MDIFVGDQNQAAAHVSDLIAELLYSKPNASIGVATGGTMVGIYDELVQRYERGALSFADARVFLLDEYIGLARNSTDTYWQTIRRLLAERTDLSDDEVFGPDGAVEDLIAEANRFDQLVNEARIDLQLLGVGLNGHLAFNEPGSSLSSRTRVVDLATTTTEANARFFETNEDVPTRALTQGVGTICQASHLVLVAFGTEKCDVVQNAIRGPVSDLLPASVIQTHLNVTVVLDHEAAQKLG